MLKLSSPKRLMLLIAASLLSIPLFISCNNNGLTNSSNPNVSTVVGRIGEPFEATSSGNSSSNTSNLGGATVQLVQIQNNGKLQIVSNQSAQTKTNGSFTVTTDQSGISNLIVTASKNGIKYESLVNSQLQKGLTSFAQPLTRMTTVQANIYSQIQAQAQGSTYVNSYPFLELLIPTRTGNAVYGDSTSQQIIAQGIVKWIDAHNLALQSSIINASNSELQSLNLSLHSSSTELQRTLYASSSDTNTTNSIYNSYLQQIFSDYVNAGISLPLYIQASAIANTTLIHNLNNLNSTVKLQLLKNNIDINSYAIALTNKSEYENLGASTALVDSSVTAFQTFQQSMVSATTESNISSAFKGYHDANVQILGTIFSKQAAAIDSVDQDINTQNGLKSQLQTNLHGLSSPQLILKAYLTYFDDIQQLMKQKTNFSNSGNLQLATDLLIIDNLY